MNEELEFYSNTADPHAPDAFSKFRFEFFQITRMHHGKAPTHEEEVGARRAFEDRLKYLSQFEIGEPVSACKEVPVEMLKKMGLVGLYRRKESK